MRVYIEHKINEKTSRGPGKFILRLVGALKKLGVECTYSPNGCDVSLGMPWWPKSNNNMPRIVRADGLAIKYGSAGIRYRRKLAKNFNSCAAIIWQSNFAKNIVGGILKVKARKEFVIPNGAQYRKNKYPKIGHLDYRHVLLCANWLRNSGRTRKIKRLPEMLTIAREYVKLHQNVVFWVAGKNNYTHLGSGNIKFLGQLNNHTLHRYIHSANCALFLGCYDACPNSLVEILVAGTPVICVNGSGPEELVKLGYGEILNIDEPASRRGMLIGRIAELPHQPILEALDRWVNCEEKKPAKNLFIKQIANRYKMALEETAEQWSK